MKKGNYIKFLGNYSLTSSLRIPITIDEDLIVPGYEEFLPEAMQLRDKYDQHVSLYL